jgi:hypothetical protein
MTRRPLTPRRDGSTWNALAYLAPRLLSCILSAAIVAGFLYLLYRVAR